MENVIHETNICFEHHKNATVAYRVVQLSLLQSHSVKREWERHSNYRHFTYFWKFGEF